MDFIWDVFLLYTNVDEGRCEIMRKSFYHFLMTYRHALVKTDISEFANAMYKDHQFPKDSMDYNLLSSYLELNGDYLPSMTIFDEAWELYIENEKK